VVIGDISGKLDDGDFSFADANDVHQRMLDGGIRRQRGVYAAPDNGRMGRFFSNDAGRIQPASNLKAGFCGDADKKNVGRQGLSQNAFKIIFHSFIQDDGRKTLFLKNRGQGKNSNGQADVDAVDILSRAGKNEKRLGAVLLGRHFLSSNREIL